LYLSKEKVPHGRIGEWPAWHLAPYVSIWAIESRFGHDEIAFWVICGDLPTDFIQWSNSASDPRQALNVISSRWLEVSSFMLRGVPHPTISIGTPDVWPKLGPLLQSRAGVIAKWVKDDSIW
jgi:hypothetical protein